MKIYKYSSLIVILLLAGIPMSVIAQSSSNINFNDIETDGDIVDRFHERDAEYAMTTREGSVDLMIVNEGIAIQFTDYFFEEMDREIKENDDFDGDNAFVKAIKAAVSSGVSNLLDYALVIPNYEISDVYYDDGRLYIINHNGEDIFEDVEINDTDIMEDFSRRNARRFVSILENRI